MEILCFLYVLSAENELVWSAVNKIAFFICHMYLSLFDGDAWVALFDGGVESKTLH